ncbi:MAG: winged helix-turn-helix domain-containing protein [Bdellovibrionales bacterium]|nr:winged helix-turn-helix domain-containing protein [Bdellovibrionales bacterium]
MNSQSPAKATAKSMGSRLSSTRSLFTGPCAIRFQAALYAYHSGDYSTALPEFEKLAERFLARGEVDHFIECAVYQIRLLAEREEFERVSAVEKKVAAVVQQASAINPKLQSRLMYVLGICHVYQGQRHDLAINFFRESIQRALAITDASGTADRSPLAWPLYGAATVLYARERYDDAIRELEKLRTLLGCFPIPEINTSAHLLHALIMRNRGEFDAALESAWLAFESLKTQPHLVLYLHTLAALGTILTEKGEVLQARLYLELAERSLKRTEFPRIARIVDSALGKLEAAEPKPFDLRFIETTEILIEAQKGEIRFDGQHILRDLLKVLLKSPGQTVGKADLVRQVWKETYTPETHDNKIYVNIKRLRRLIESEDGSTEYILRGKSGYYLNPKARVEVIEK